MTCAVIERPSSILKNHLRRYRRNRRDKNVETRPARDHFKVRIAAMWDDTEMPSLVVQQGEYLRYLASPYNDLILSVTSTSMVG